MELTKAIPELGLYDREWPIRSHQEQLPPEKFVLGHDDQRAVTQ